MTVVPPPIARAYAHVAHTMLIEQPPRSPTYMAYMFTPEAGKPNDSVLLAQKKPGPYQPATQMSQAEQALRDGRGVYEHFHVPCNDHNRFLVEVK
jgi:hypothetical protein